MRLSRWLLVVFVAALLAGIGLPVVQIVFGTTLLDPWVVIPVAWMTVGLAGTAAGAAALAERGTMAALMASGTGAAIVAWLAWIGAILTQAGGPGDQLLWVTVGTVGTCAAVAIVLVGLLGRVPLRGRWARRARGAAWVLVALLAAHVAGSVCLGMMLARFDDGRGLEELRETALRIGGVIGVCTGASVTAVVIAAGLPHLRGRPEEAIERLAITIRCPRCGLIQAFSTGGSHCRSCGLRVKVTAS